ncbi:MAG: flagellar protein FlaG [Idiomarina sp.]
MAAEINAVAPRVDTLNRGDKVTSQSDAERKEPAVQTNGSADKALSETLAKQQAEQAKENEMSEEERAQFLQAVADNLNESKQLNRRNLQFSVNEDADRTVIKVVDAKSGDVIRQIPSEDLVRLAERLREDSEQVGQVVGMLIDSRI